MDRLAIELQDFCEIMMALSRDLSAMGSHIARQHVSHDSYSI